MGFSRKFRHRYGRVLCVAFLYAHGFVVTAAPQDINALKAAYIFNFSKFVSWPQGSDSQERDNIVICLDTGNDAITQQLKGLEGKTVNRKPLVVQAIDEHTGGAISRQCHVLYRDAAATTEVPDLSGVLVVSEVRDEQTIVVFTINNGKLSFEIDAGRADAQGLVISSRLLQLARKVYQ